MHAMNTACQTASISYEMMKAQIMESPTHAMRALLQRHNIWARAGYGLVEIWPCRTLKQASYEILPMRERCSVEIPVKLILSGKQYVGYLDATTNIIYRTWPHQDCSLVDQIPVNIEGKTGIYVRHTGRVIPQDDFSVLEYLSWQRNFTWDYQPEIYKQVTMYSWDETTSSKSLNDLLGSLEMHDRVFNHLGIHPSYAGYNETNEFIHVVVSKSLFSWLAGVRVFLWQAWVSTACFYLTLALLIKWCLPRMVKHMLKRYWEQLQRAVTELHRRNRNSNSPESQSQVQELASYISFPAPVPPQAMPLPPPPSPALERRSSRTSSCVSAGSQTLVTQDIHAQEDITDTTPAPTCWPANIPTYGQVYDSPRVFMMRTSGHKRGVITDQGSRDTMASTSTGTEEAAADSTNPQIIPVSVILSDLAKKARTTRSPNTCSDASTVTASTSHEDRTTSPIAVQCEDRETQTTSNHEAQNTSTSEGAGTSKKTEQANNTTESKLCWNTATGSAPIQLY